MRRGFIGLTLAVLAVAWLSAQAPYYPPAGQWAHKSPGEVGMDAAKLDDAIAFMKAHETNSPTRDFSDQEIVNGKLLASIPTERAGDERAHHPPRLHRRRVRRHDAARSDLQRRQEHAVDGRRHRARSRPDSGTR